MQMTPYGCCHGNRFKCKPVCVGKRLESLALGEVEEEALALGDVEDEVLALGDVEDEVLALGDGHVGTGVS